MQKYLPARTFRLHARWLHAIAACVFIATAFAGCGEPDYGDPWPPEWGVAERATHPVEQTFRRKNWRDAIRVTPNGGRREIDLGEIGDARYLHMGILREGMRNVKGGVRVFVNNELIHEVGIIGPILWNDYSIDLEEYDPHYHCHVTFDLEETIWVSPLELVPEESPKPNVLVVVLDTLRADHCSLYGYERNTTPRLDAFAEGAVTFENMVSASSWTRPSIASLFSSTYPGVHGARDYTDVMRSDVPRIATVLGENGYRTIAIARNANIHPYWGIGDEFFNYGFFGVGSGDEEVMLVAKRLIPNLKGASWFMYIHLLDPHGPYLPPSSLFGPYKGMTRGEYTNAYLDRALSRDPEYSYYLRDALQLSEEQYAAQLEAYGGYLPEPDPLADIIAESMDLYDSEIVGADARFGEILDKLEETGQLENTMIVFLSDHGEEFYEHGQWSHGKTVFEEGLHVPLVIRLPKNEHGGRRSASLVETVDVAPTILEYLGIEIPPAMQGRSLLPMIEGQEDPDHIAFSSVFRENYPPAEFSAARWQHYKLIVDHRIGEKLYFDLKEDPGETAGIETTPPKGEEMLARIESTRYRKSSGLHFVFTSELPHGGADVFEGKITVPGMEDYELLYIADRHTIKREGDTLTFKIEMSDREIILGEHRPTHAELVVDADIGAEFTFVLWKNGEPVPMFSVPQESGVIDVALNEGAVAMQGIVAPAHLATVAAVPVDNRVYGWYIPEGASIPESEMDAEMRETLETMGYL